MPEIGVNLNNREPLLTDEYSINDMFHMAVQTEELGFDSVWVGDNLLEKPRLEPISCLAKVAGLTDTVDLGTACMVTSLQNPVQFAQAWATLDMISDGRMILGACMGEPTKENRKQHDVVGVDPRKRAHVFEEGLEIMQTLWADETVDYDGEYFTFEDVSFDTGNEVVPLATVQDDPRVHVVSNPNLHGKEAVQDRAVQRIVDIGSGWMSCCRADHRNEYEAQVDAIHSYARVQGVDPDSIDMSYQITANIADSEEQGKKEMRDYIESYYPQHDIEDENLDDWGPIGPADRIIDWIERFDDLGCDHFIVRFGGYDQLGQMERFADEVLPAI